MKSRYRTIGLSITIGWLLIVCLYGIFSWQKFLNLTPNELGDFLAGALGPLGVLWLVLGFWQQGDELRNSVEALQLQSLELKNSVEQQKALVEVSREQLESEIQARGDERQQRLWATTPRFNLVSGGGSSQGGNKFRSGLTLLNVGADCSNILVVDAETGAVVKRTTQLQSKQELQFEVPHSAEDHIDFELRIEHTTILGESKAARFRLTRPNAYQVGFNIEQLKTL